MASRFSASKVIKIGLIGMLALATSSVIAAQPPPVYFVVNCARGFSLNERMDPIVNPGAVATHDHVISGGNALNFSTTYKQLRSSTCTTCSFSDDLSAYWSPALYFQKSDGTFIPVPYQNQGGGMAIYYNSGTRTPTGEFQYNAFPPGLRMVVGDHSSRSCDGDPNAAKIAMSCNGNTNGADGQKYTYFPTWKCTNSLRLEVNFPGCWDGVNLYLPGSAHMSYPDGGHAQYGNCPVSHPVPLPSLFFEIGYDISSLPMGTGGKLVFSNGDASGCGLHADFYNGWDIDKLLDAMKNNNAAKSVSSPGGCAVPVLLTEKTDGTLNALPGCNPVSGKGEKPENPLTCSADTQLGGPIYSDATTVAQYNALQGEPVSNGTSGDGQVSINQKADISSGNAESSSLSGESNQTFTSSTGGALPSSVASAVPLGKTSQMLGKVALTTAPIVSAHQPMGTHGSCHGKRREP